MSLTAPYKQHNYLGECTNDAAALTFIQTNHWDSNNNGTGSPRDGMWYYNIADSVYRGYLSGDWVTIGNVIGPGAPVTDQAIARFNGGGGLDIESSRVNISDAGDMLPAVNDSQDIGSSSQRFSENWNRILVGVAGNDTVSLLGGFGGAVVGRSFSSGTGSSLLQHGGSGYPPILLAANSFAVNGCTAHCKHRAGGGSMLASAYASGSGSTAAVESYSYGSFTGGYAWGQGTSGSATLKSDATGSFLWAYVATAGTGIAQTSGAGAFASGRLEGPGSTNLSAAGKGSFVQGMLNASSGRLATLESTTVANGGFAQGYVLATTATSRIRSNSRGAFAQGYAVNANIEANGRGAFAVGYTQGNTSIIASGNNSAQFGPGTNSEINTLSAGTGIRIKGTTGAPVTPRVGDIWPSASGHIEMRTPTGVNLGFTRPTITGSRGGNAALANLLTSLATMNFIVDSTSA